MNAILLGDRSDIASAIRPMLEADGWKVIGWHRGNSLPSIHWDLCLIAMGSVAPVGHWWTLNEMDVYRCLESNLELPLTFLRHLWLTHNENAYICWLAGSNPNEIMDGYSAYNISKMAVLKAVEQLDHETSDATFFALGPGTVITKIHEATLNADWHNPKLQAALDDPTHSKVIMNALPKVYQCLKWCLSQPKNVIGGRNICVSDGWDKHPKALATELVRFPSVWKLRRYD